MLINNKGVTLVALSVTIIILIILAGVTVGLALNNNGLLEQAKEARNSVEGQDTKIEEEMNSIYSKLTGDVQEDWKDNVKEIKNGVPIPYGYYYVGGTKNTGVVISDNINDENATNYTAQDGLKGNQWVWVPVPDANSLYETASSPIAITGGSSLSVVTGVSTSKYSKSGIISGQTRGLPNSTSYREPDILVSYKAFDAVESNRAEAGFAKMVNGTVTTMTVSEMAQTVVDEYNEMIASIEKYGGFYIGRYEMSSAGLKKDQPTLTNVNWYTLYGKCKELAKNETVKTRMIWGCQWDVTCNWIANNGDKKSISNSSNWGNYNDAISPANTGNYESGVKKNTGSNEAWKANNIYDFAGNCSEWTQEADFSIYRACRGGYCNDNGSGSPAVNRYGTDPEHSVSNLRFSSHFNIATIAP